MFSWFCVLFLVFLHQTNTMNAQEIIYVCIPYTWNPEESFKIANKVSAKLISDGHVVLSPISHSHPISKYMHPKLQFDQKTWMKQDIPLLLKCTKIYVVLIQKHGGIELVKNSKGCTCELEEANKNNIPIIYYEYNG